MDDRIEADVFITGTPYCHIAEFAEELYDRYGIRAAATGDVKAAKRLISEIHDSSEQMIFIHIALPAEKLAAVIETDYGLSADEALAIAEEAEMTERIEDFDETVPDDVAVITWAGETERSLDQFVCICANMIGFIQDGPDE